MANQNFDDISFAAASDAARFANESRAQHPTGRDLSFAAAQDAARVTAQDPSQGTLRNAASANLDTITPAEANIIMSEEHKALGYRPPSGSLAAEAQRAAVNSTGDGEKGVQRSVDLKEAARVDAARIAVERGDPAGAISTVDLDNATKEEVARLQSEEQKRLGHRPPPGSLAAKALSAADRNATGNRINGGPAGIDPNKITQEEMSRLMSEEHKRLGHRPPPESLSAQSQAVVSSLSS